MKYKQAKRIKEKLSAIGFGCWGISGPSIWNDSNDDDSIRAIHAAVDMGINLFDVAPVYGFGHAEEVLGKALKSKKRDSVVIASKCGFVWDPGVVNCRKCLKKESVLKEIDESLKRLDTDYIDVYQCHWPVKDTEIEETMEAMVQLLKAGKIRYVGLTNFPVPLAERAEKCVEISSQQGLYNMLERNAKSYYNHTLEYRTERETLPYVKEKGQAFFPYSPLLQGLLTGSFTKSDNYDETDIRNKNPKLVGADFEKYYAASKKLEAIAADMGVPLNQVALQWLVMKEEITTVIAGALDERQLLSNLKALDVKIDPESMAKIADVIADFEDE